MREQFQVLLEKAKSGSELAESLVKEGINSAQGVWQGMGVFRSLSALSVSDLEKDETHYLLISCPVLDSEQTQMVLFSKRVIPEGYGATNSLPKERVFHLPDLSAEERMREQLTSSLIVQEHRKEEGNLVNLATRLDMLAEEIDQETDKVSGGILLVGGLTTLINPVVGIGMMASGVLPKLGGKFAKSGVTMAGEQLRNWSQKSQQKKAEKSAVTEVARLKPTIFINPILQRLDSILTNPTGKEDPLLDKLDWSEGFPNQRYLQITAEGVNEAYEEILERKKSPLTSPVRAWVESLKELKSE